MLDSTKISSKEARHASLATSKKESQKILNTSSNSNINSIPPKNNNLNNNATFLSSGSYPMVGLSTRLIPFPPEQTISYNGRVDLRPGNLGGPEKAIGNFCQNNAYQINIPEDVKPGNWTMLLMSPGQSISYIFNPLDQATPAAGFGKWLISPRESGGAWPGSQGIFATISDSPCDFNYARRDLGDKCYAMDKNGYYALDGILDIKEYEKKTGQKNMCSLNPHKRYYLNIRWENADFARGIDSCAKFKTNCAADISP